MQAKENKMGVMPINRLLINMSMPMVVSMLIMALYNVVDSVFVARISEDALTGVSTAFPFQNLMIAVSTGTGVGLNALISKSLGEKNREKASDFARHGIFLAACSYLVFLLLGIFMVRPYFESQPANAAVIEYGVEYTTIVTVLSFGSFGQIAFERIMQSTGKTVYTMITQICGAGINLIFDPIFIFGFHMGVAGAAYATVLGQIVAFVVAFSLNHFKNHELDIDMKRFRLSGKTIGRIYAIGVPSIIMSSIGSVMYYAVNYIVMAMSSTAAAVFGVYFKLQSFVFMPVFGLNNGLIPIIGFNYGAQNRRRILKTFRLGILYAVVIMCLGTLIFQTVPWLLLDFFKASDHMLSIGIPALRIISLCFAFAGVDIVIGSLFQAFGHGLASMCVSVTRQLVVLVPAAYLLSLTGKVVNVWWCFPISEIASLLVSVLYLLHLNRKVISKIPDGSDVL